MCGLDAEEVSPRKKKLQFFFPWKNTNPQEYGQNLVQERNV